MRMTREQVVACVMRGYQEAIEGRGLPTYSAITEAICPEGHTIEVFGPEWERTEEDGKIVWQKKKPYWTVYNDTPYWTCRGRNGACAANWNINCVPNAKERAEQLAAEMNRDYPDGLPK